MDVLFGGAPCQGFSMIGKRALEDPRNSLVHHFVRLVVELKASYFVFENVRGLAVGAHRKFLEEIIAEFRKSGYNVVENYRVLNAAHHGVPQNRQRLFLMGARRGFSLPEYPEATHDVNRDRSNLFRRSTPTVWDALRDIPEADDYEELLHRDWSRRVSRNRRITALPCGEKRPIPRTTPTLASSIRHYLHPACGNFLRHRSSGGDYSPWTDGVPLFQEQLIKIAMIAADFSGGQAEELRRAFGFKRSEKRIREVEVKLREGMERNEITGEIQDRIVQAITSFALYGFPESHAASFALLAYASAYLKCHYLAAFTVAMLNNQPMGFYSPATLVKDAQRHGQRFRPVDILRSDYLCTVETDGKTKYVRLGLNYVRGLSSATARKIEEERKQGPFTSLRDLARRVPDLHKDEIAALSELGALNALPKDKSDRHRRGALWQSELALQVVGELLEPAADDGIRSPLDPMTPEQRTSADFSNSGLSIGKHPMAYYRGRMREMGVMDAATAKAQRNGMVLKVGGCVITRQRPGTAKGFVFMSLEDETGIVNVIIQPDLFDRRRQVCTAAPYVLKKPCCKALPASFP